VSSEIFDHTSQILFLEERFGIHSSNISAWRRQTVGNLTSTLQMKSVNVSSPPLPSTSGYRTEALTVQGCTSGDVDEISINQPLYPLASVQNMPSQEPGVAKQVPPTAT
jgi:phospholipase C